jgi:NAD(P)-dependent dehydrogenase (short-subunit alcohol dehydrogenase family)
MPLDTLKDKVAVVTGSARGVGWATVHALAAEGAKVVVADRTEKARPDLMMPNTIYDVAEQIKEKGGTAIPVKVDLRHEDQIIELKNKTLEAYGTVDIVVNNAAITFGAKVWELPTERWDQVMAVNPRASFIMAKNFLPILMEKRSGSIINLSSPAGRGPAPGMSIYSASKAAIDYFTLSLAAEVKEYNIAVNCIAPTGAIYSEGNLQLFKEQSWIDTWEPREHFALGVVWLAKQDAQSFTGNLVYSRQLISQMRICTKWCCAAMGSAPSVGGPMRVDWESNLPALITEALPATG